MSNKFGVGQNISVHDFAVDLTVSDMMAKTAFTYAQNKFKKKQHTTKFSVCSVGCLSVNN